MNKNAKIQKKKQEEPQALQRKASKAKTMAPPQFALNTSPAQKKESSSTSAGSATKLTGNVLDKVNGAVGMDLKDVRVHASSEKAVDAGALAFAQGNEIHFAPGQYNPDTKKGQELIAHEAAHIKQQAEGRVQADGEVAGMSLNSQDKHEKEADAVAAAIDNPAKQSPLQAKKVKPASGAAQLKKKDEKEKDGAPAQLKKKDEKEKDGAPAQLKKKDEKDEPVAAPTQLKKAKDDKNAPVQRFKMRDEDMAKYPKFTQFVSEQMPNNINDPRLVHYLNKYGENTGDNQRDIRSDLNWGSGPEIHPFALSANKVSFASNKGSEVIRLSRQAIEGYEKNQTNQQDFHRLVLESNILSGYTSFLDDQDGKDYYGKEGKLLEKAEFGKDIETVWDAKDARRGKFGKGEWEMTVVSAQGPNPQRIRLWNSANADGAYDAKPGTKIAVQSGTYGDFMIRTQFLPEGKMATKDGDYKNSEMLTNKVGKDEYMVRSEHTGDGDRQDLVLKVVKKSGNS